MPLTPDLVRRALAEVSKSTANYDYFFRRLSSPEWIGPLRDAGFFSGAPEAIEDSEGIRVPGWLPSEYLTRVAALAPEEVAEVVLSIDTKNERVHRDFAQAAMAMPGPLAAKVAKRERKWLSRQSSLYFGLSIELADLVRHLADTVEVDAAFALARTLLALKKQPDAPAVVGRQWRGLESDWSYGETLRKVVPALLAVDPVRTLEFLVGLLHLVADSAAPEEARWAGDAFRVSRPRLEADDRPDLDVDRALLSVLRDAARRASVEGLIPQDELIAILGPEASRLFHRLACHALQPPPSTERAALRRVLLLEDAFFESEPSPEYRALLRESFARLSEADRAVILNWIESGPPERPGWDERFADDVELERWKASWRIKRLALLRDDLPPDWRARYDQLVEQYGEKEFGTSFEMHTWSGPESPKTLEELEVLGDEDLLGLLRTYEGGDGWFGPSRDGLARTLSGLAEKDSARLSRLAPQLAGLLPIYIHWVLIGLENALRKRAAVDWAGLTELFEAVVGREDEAPFNLERDDTIGRWTWVRKSIADLLVLAFEITDVEAPYDLRSCLWAVLEQLTDDEEPDAEYEREYGSGVSDPATTALNTVRGRALQAAVNYAMWVKRNAETEAGESVSLLDETPEALRVLEAHLDPARDSSPSVRSVYGQYFPWLVVIGEAWAQQLVPRVFPRGADWGELRAAAWECYLAWSAAYDSCFRVLGDEYLVASRETERAPRWEWLGSRYGPRVGLGSHLVAFYLRGLICLDEADGHLASFFRASLPKTRSEVLAAIGRSFSSRPEVNGEVAKRLMALWAWRLREVTSGDDQDRMVELGGFSWWLACEGLPAEWRLAQLETLLAYPAVLQPGLFAYEFLATVAAEWPLRVVAVLRALVDQGVGTWPGLVGSDHIREALRVCLAGDDATARAQADELVQLLGAKGYGDFRDLVRPSGSD